MKTLPAAIFLFSFYSAAPQPLSYPDKKPSVASANAASLYFNSQSKTLAIHNGRIFYGYPGMIGHAFYPEPLMQNGSLFYDGTWYPDISFIYDIFKDEVITLHPNSALVRLFSERVQQFYFQGQSFVYLSPNDKDHVIKSGFYQRLADGAITIYARRRKIIEEKIVEVRLERRFIFSTQYFVFKDGIYYEINKQKSLLNLLKGSKPGLVQHLKTQKLKFKTDKEKTIVEIANFYNQSYK
ncbi:MAG: hypothetical protein ACXWWC_08915 [Chitinophagaceae bacterium]